MSIPNKDVKQTTDKAEAVVSEQKNAQSGKATNNKNFNKKDKKSNTTSTSNVNNSKNSESISEKTEKPQPEKTEKVAEKPAPKKEEKETKKSGGTAIALLALLISLGVGGAGYYFGMQKFNQLEQKIASHSQQLPAGSSSEGLEQKFAELSTKLENQVKADIQAGLSHSMMNGQTTASEGGEKTDVVAHAHSKMKELAENYAQSQQKLAKLEAEQTAYAQQITQLRSQLNVVEQATGNTTQTRSVASVLADTDFLLNNALRKMLADNDVESAKALLKDALNAVSISNSPELMQVQAAIKSDLTKLANIHDVDQDALMLKLTQLAKNVDDLPMLNEQDEPVSVASSEVSSSVEDWKKNLENSAESFLSHFIRINDKSGTSLQKVFTSPSQEAYLRENIRLRLQIATLAIPRMQTALYKESLETAATWVRSYFDVEDSHVKAFLNEVDKLADQPIYTDTPQQLTSLDLLNSLSGQSEQAKEQ
ncbi:Putative uroporphyrinogen-III C-methyltransferase [Phocoenobacter uteri]|uniref:Uroporphyrinogen-III C-methyltransferase n=1 Tax=Phocoenobacter uteri TaxID=146806 RepID=A0A379CAG4_9PAST|nr:uroporphyrinogen-III C-methyltransferase [Phocoenobacter uteri]MDG6881239.1 hypothetical protein [Phocoenobacter uteri]SUB59261.1 Putative uroporphyrinogen-III C-methyltransferase [Phocoenobacter uteri]